MSHGPSSSRIILHGVDETNGNLTATSQLSQRRKGVMILMPTSLAALRQCAREHFWPDDAREEEEEEDDEDLPTAHVNQLRVFVREGIVNSTGRSTCGVSWGGEVTSESSFSLLRDNDIVEVVRVSSGGGGRPAPEEVRKKEAGGSALKRKRRHIEEVASDNGSSPPPVRPSLAVGTAAAVAPAPSAPSSPPARPSRSSSHIDSPMPPLENAAGEVQPSDAEMTPAKTDMQSHRHSQVTPPAQPQAPQAQPFPSKLAQPTSNTTTTPFTVQPILSVHDTFLQAQQTLQQQQQQAALHQKQQQAAQQQLLLQQLSNPMSSMYQTGDVAQQAHIFSMLSPEIQQTIRQQQMAQLQQQHQKQQQIAAQMKQQREMQEQQMLLALQAAATSRTGATTSSTPAPATVPTTPPPPPAPAPATVHVTDATSTPARPHQPTTTTTTPVPNRADRNAESTPQSANPAPAAAAPAAATPAPTTPAPAATAAPATPAPAAAAAAAAAPPPDAGAPSLIQLNFLRFHPGPDGSSVSDPTVSIRMKSRKPLQKGFIAYCQFKQIDIGTVTFHATKPNATPEQCLAGPDAFQTERLAHDLSPHAIGWTGQQYILAKTSGS